MKSRVDHGYMKTTILDLLLHKQPSELIKLLKISCLRVRETNDYPYFTLVDTRRR